jgi:hypothetical protein
MDRKTAQSLITQYLKFGEIFNCVTELSDAIDDVETRKRVRRAVAEAQGFMYEGLVQPVVKEFPDLEPRDEVSEFLER